MLAKEWRDARWKLLLAALAVLAFVVFAPRSYEAILQTVERDIRTARADLASPEAFMERGMQPAYYEQAEYEESLRGTIEEMRQPDYPVQVAESDMTGLSAGAGLALVPLAALLGVALVSGEVSRGTIFLLLSQPISRTRVLLTKYLVGVAVLLAVALLGGVGIVTSGYAHGYPAASINVAKVLASSGLFWMGTLSVLGVATLASVLFRDVIRSVIATTATLYAIFYLPDLMRGVASLWLAPSEQEYREDPMAANGWYRSFETFRIINYWHISDAYGGPFGSQPDPVLNLLVCFVTAALPLIAAFWLFRRKNY